MLPFPWIISDFWEQGLHPGPHHPNHGKGLRSLSQQQLQGRFRPLLIGRTLTFTRNLIPASFSELCRPGQWRPALKTRCGTEYIFPLISSNKCESIRDEFMGASTKKHQEGGHLWQGRGWESVVLRGTDFFLCNSIQRGKKKKSLTYWIFLES